MIDGKGFAMYRRILIPLDGSPPGISRTPTS
jgi:hypothetical protein